MTNEIFTLDDVTVIKTRTSLAKLYGNVKTIVLWAFDAIHLIKIEEIRQFALKTFSTIRKRSLGGTSFHIIKFRRSQLNTNIVGEICEI